MEQSGHDLGCDHAVDRAVASQPQRHEAALHSWDRINHW